MSIQDVLIICMKNITGKNLVLQSCIQETNECEENKLNKLWNSKIGYSDEKCEKNGRLKTEQNMVKTETSSFSSIVSSLSDSNSQMDESMSNKFSVVEDNDEMSVRSHWSHDSGSTCEENSKFFDNKCKMPGNKDDKRKSGFSGFFTKYVFFYMDDISQIFSYLFVSIKNKHIRNQSETHAKKKKKFCR